MASSAADALRDLAAEREPVARALGSFSRFWSYPLLRWRWSRTLLIFTVFALCAVRACLGLVDSRQYSHDAFMFLDGAWRMLNGQRPHIDFYSHLGFLTYLPTLIGLKLSHDTAWGMGYGHAICGVLIGLWSYLLARKRLADVPLVLFCLCVTLVAVAPFALGEPMLQVSFAMTYNRFGYALLALLLVEAFAIPLQPVSERAGGFSTGLVIGILLFLKITYFVFAIILLAVLILCRPQSRRRWLGIGAGCVLVALACSAYFHFHLLPMFADLRMVAGGKHILLRAYMLDEIFVRALGLIAFSISAALLLLSGQGRQRSLSVLLAGFVTAFTGAALILGNYEQSGFPLGVFLALLVLNELAKEPSPKVKSADPFRFSVLLLGSVFVAGSLFSGFLSTATALAGRFYIPRILPPLQSASLSGFIPAGDDFWYGAYINDGLRLIRQLGRPGDSLMCLDFSNPFSYGLAMKPAPGGTTVLQYKTTFDDKHHPSPQWLFGAARLVAIPTKFTDDTLSDTVERIYGSYLRSHFHLIGSSKCWLLYRQN